jgi:RNA polymerase sigma-70 factor (ECF subfamily)
MAHDGLGAGGPRTVDDSVRQPTDASDVAAGPERLDSSAPGAEPPRSTSSPRVEAFERFYRRELPRLAALAQALCGVSSADDVAQEAMLAAYRRWDEVSGYASPEAWVRRVCANKATSILRRRGAETRAVLRLASNREGEVPVPEHEAFWAEVRRLPRRQAQAAALRYVYDMSLEDIAVVLGCSSGAVKVHLARARKVLGQRLADTGQEAT